jgi:hypothetical protein
MGYVLFFDIANQLGEKAFTGYLKDKSEWKDHDATELLKGFKGELDVLIDVVCAVIWTSLTP